MSSQIFPSKVQIYNSHLIRHHPTRSEIQSKVELYKSSGKFRSCITIWQSSIVIFSPGNNTEKENISATIQTDHCVRTGNNIGGEKKEKKKIFHLLAILVKTTKRFLYCSHILQNLANKATAYLLDKFKMDF